MNAKAAAAACTLIVGSGLIGAAWYMSTPGSTPATTPTPTPTPPERDEQRLDFFSMPVTPGPAQVFFNSAAGEPIPARSRREVDGMIGMMSALMERMHEFDVNGDGMLDNLEKAAMGFKLRKEFLAEHDLDGDGDMSRDEWRAFQKSMFEQTPEGQRLMSRFDLDGDGVLNEEEQAAFDAHLEEQERARQAEQRNRMDTNNDGEVSRDERQPARRQEHEFWQKQMRTADTNFDYDGDGELNIEETHDAWDAWIEYQTVDDFINRYDRDGDRSMGPSDYDAFLSDYDRRNPEADVNRDGEIDIKDIAAYRDLVLRSRTAS